MPTILKFSEQATPNGFVHSMRLEYIDEILEAFREAHDVLQELLSAQSEYPQAWKRYFGAESANPTATLIFTRIRLLLAEIVLTNSSARMPGHIIEQPGAVGSPQILQPPAKRFTILKVNYTLPVNAQILASICPREDTMHLYPGFFLLGLTVAQCAALCAGKGQHATEENILYSRAVILIHELVHYMTYLCFEDMMATVDEEARIFARVSSLCMAIDLSICIPTQREGEPKQSPIVLPYCMYCSKGGPMKSIGESWMDENGEHWDAYGLLGAQKLAQSEYGATLSLFNADNYACFVASATAARMLQLRSIGEPWASEDRRMIYRKIMLDIQALLEKNPLGF